MVSIEAAVITVVTIVVEGVVLGLVAEVILRAIGRLAPGGPSP